MALVLSDTYPEQTTQSRGKTLYRYNVREVKITDPMTKQIRIQYEYNEVEIEGEATRAKVQTAMRLAKLNNESGESVASLVALAKDKNTKLGHDARNTKRSIEELNIVVNHILDILGIE